MKTFFTMICLLVCISVKAQYDVFPVEKETGKVVYTEVVKSDGVSKDELYTRAKLWFAGANKSAKEVVQLDDKDSGLIVGKGFTQISYKKLGVAVPVKMYYTAKIAIKDGRYKYDITDIYFEESPTASNDYKVSTAYPSDLVTKYYGKNGKPVNYIVDYMAAAKSSMNALISSLKEGMSKPATEMSGSNDW